MRYCFLLSYASIDRKQLKPDLVRTFFDDLQQKVALLGWSEGGFLDATGIENGQRWERRLADALAKSCVLVPLCSPNYFRSEHCGREWSVFRSRYSEGAEENRDSQRYILPVHWVPTPELMRIAPEIQSADDSYPEIYRKEGLCYVMSTRRYRDDYEEFLHHFAKDVAAAAEAAGRKRHWPVPALPAVVPAFAAPEPASQSDASGEVDHAVVREPDAPRIPAAASHEHDLDDPARVRWYDRVRPAWLLWIGLAVWFVSNLLSILGSSSLVVAAVHERYGPEVLYGTKRFMSVLVTLGFFVGYSLPAAAFMLWARRWQVRVSTRILYTALVLLAATVALTANVTYTSSRTGLTSVVHEQVRDAIDELTTGIVARQQDTPAPEAGSFLFSPDLNETRAHAWTNAQATVGILAAMKYDPKYHKYAYNVQKALTSLEGARSEDGWKNWPDTTKTVTDVTAWALIAHALALSSPAARLIAPNPEIYPALLSRVKRDADALVNRQHKVMGGWAPVVDPGQRLSNLRTYSTVVAVWALVETREVPGIDGAQYDASIKAGIRWLLRQYEAHNMWVPKPSRANQVERFPGLDAQTLFVLYRAQDEKLLSNDHVLTRAKRQILREHLARRVAVRSNERTHDSDTRLDGIDFSVEPSTFLWYPWTYAVLTRMAEDPHLTPEERATAETARIELGLRSHEVRHQVKSEFMYVRAENAYCLAASVDAVTSE